MIEVVIYVRVDFGEVEVTRLKVDGDHVEIEGDRTLIDDGPPVPIPGGDGHQQVTFADHPEAWARGLHRVYRGGQAPYVRVIRDD